MDQLQKGVAEIIRVSTFANALKRAAKLPRFAENNPQLAHTGK